jgi:hypothetical protein
MTAFRDLDKLGLLNLPTLNFHPHQPHYELSKERTVFGKLESLQQDSRGKPDYKLVTKTTGELTTHRLRSFLPNRSSE